MYNEQLRRTPLFYTDETTGEQRPIRETPKIEVHAIKKALKHDALAAGATLSGIDLESKSGLKETIRRIDEANDIALEEFISSSVVSVVWGDNDLFEILDNLVLTPLGKAKKIRDWMEGHRGIISGVDSLYLDQAIDALPREISYFGSLNTLSVQGGTRNDKPHFIKALPSRLRSLNLTELSLTHHGLRSIPTEIQEMPNLQKLELWNNKITSIPDDFFRSLTALERLNLGRNRFQSIPSEIEELTSLTILELQENAIDFVPPGIGNLKGLISLDLSENRISSLPGTVEQLTALKTLCLDGNLFHTFPAVICHLTALDELVLGSNNFSSVPEGIKKLTALELCSLSDNRIDSIPSLEELTALERLYLDNNRLRTLPTFAPQARVSFENNPLTLQARAVHALRSIMGSWLG